MMNTCIRCLCLPLVFIVLTNSAQAGEGILVHSVAGGSDNSHVLPVVQQALVGRQWTVEKVDATSVTATISHSSYEARIRIYLAGEALLYQEAATKTAAAHNGNPAMDSGPRVKTNAATPARWIDFLRNDISKALASVPAAETQRNPDQSSSQIAQRLMTLEDLHTAKLISQDEYDKKRADILSGL